MVGGTDEGFGVVIGWSIPWKGGQVFAVVAGGAGDGGIRQRSDREVAVVVHDSNLFGTMMP